jgi:hypothetical protein
MDTSLPDCSVKFIEETVDDNLLKASPRDLLNGSPSQILAT